MQEEYSLLREQNFQLKNQISQLKNAFDLNRDILKIISQQSKSSQPRIQMLYQIINRLTSINNQIMINTAELIHQKNTHKFQKESLKRQNELLKERIDEMLEKEYVMNKTNKINELSVYFKNKLNQMENQMKALEEDRIIKEHQIQFLTKKLQIQSAQYYEGEQKKISLIPTIDKNNPPRKFLQPPPSTLTPPLQHARKYSSNKQIKLEIKLQILKKQFHALKIYSQELQYRLLTLVKYLGHQDDIKKKDTNNVKKQHRKCLEEQYSQQMAEVRLLKFALNNLVKKQSQEGKDYMFTLTRRGPINNPQGTKHTSENTRANYLYKSIEKDNRVKMKPTLLQTQNDENEQ